MKETLIKWEKWFNPFNKPDRPEFVDEDDYEGTKKWFSDEESSTTTYRITPATLTPFGLLPINSNNDPDKAFNFWFGHCNFNLGEAACETISKTDGVEIFDIFSPYRFRIAIGKCFGEDAVKKNIAERIRKLGRTQSEINASNLSDLKAKLSADSTNWIIYEWPNGDLEYFSSEDPKEFKEKVERVRSLKVANGGNIHSSQTVY